MLSSPHNLETTAGLTILDDGRSILSASSSGSATLIDMVSQRSSATINAAQINQYRK